MNGGLATDSSGGAVPALDMRPRSINDRHPAVADVQHDDLSTRIIDHAADPVLTPTRPPVTLERLAQGHADQGWRIAHNAVLFTGASSVAVTRYRYHGANIPTPRPVAIGS